MSEVGSVVVEPGGSKSQSSDWSVDARKWRVLRSPLDSGASFVQTRRTGVWCVGLDKYRSNVLDDLLSGRPVPSRREEDTVRDREPTGTHSDTVESLVSTRISPPGVPRLTEEEGSPS